MSLPSSFISDSSISTDCSCSCKCDTCRGGDASTPTRVRDAWPPPIRPPISKEQKLSHQTVRVLLVPYGSTEDDGLNGAHNPGHWRLNEEGVAQAYAVMENLQLTSIDAVYSSDLGSALSTAQIILEGQSGLPPLEVDPNLKIFDQARLEEMASSVDDPGDDTTPITSGQDIQPYIEKRCMSFWVSLFNSNHPLACRPAIDAELTVPMGQFVHSKKNKLDKVCRDGHKREGYTSGSVQDCSLGKGLRSANGSKPDLTIVIISDPASIRALLQSLTIHRGKFHEPLQWERSASQIAQEMDFWPSEGSITEFIMTGTQNRSPVVTTARYRDRKSERRYWTWEGTVEKFGDASHLKSSTEPQMDTVVPKSHL